MKNKIQDIDWTPEMVEDFNKCKNDIIYFTEKYVKIVNPDVGLTNTVLYDWQKTELNNWINNRFSNCVSARQIGSTTIQAIFLLHQALFNNNYRTAALYTREVQAKYFKEIILKMYDGLPYHIKSDLTTNNKNHLIFANGSDIMVSVSTATNIRGYSLNSVIIDNSAFSHESSTFLTKFGIETDYSFENDLIASIVPMISASKTGKIILCGTPPSKNCMQSTLRTNPTWVTTFYDYTQCPHFTPQWLELIKTMMGESWKKELLLNHLYEPATVENAKL
jgi:hypothetical protein